jgi:type II secretory pathway component GspD/PulD (secretin)
MKRIGKVICVPDRRTASIVVSAAKALMPQISAMVDQLDANPARKQKVFVYSLENADPQDAQQILQNLFQSSNNSRNSSANSSTQNNPLTARQTKAQSSSTSSSSFGSGLGNSGSGGRSSIP